MNHLRSGNDTNKSGSREIADSEDESNSDAEKSIGAGELSSFNGTKEECKMVLCVRTDLGMGKGMTSTWLPEANINLRQLAS